MSKRKFKFKSDIPGTKIPTDTGWMVLYHNFTFFKFKKPYKLLISSKGYNENYGLISFFKSSLNFNDANSAIIILSITFDTLILLSPILDYIKNNNIKKIYFFIDDVVRLYHPQATGVIDSSVLERFPGEVSAGELDIIQHIINKCKIDYEIYHDEANAKLLEEKYNYKIKYFDCVLARGHGDVYILTYNFNYKVSCFNLRHEIYRSCISALLYNIPDVLLTLNHRYKLPTLIANQELPLNKFSPNIKEKILTGYADILNNEIELSWDIPAQKNNFDNMFIEHRDLKNNEQPIQDSFVKLVTETRFCSPMPNIGEKTIKPISVYRPFIIMAAPKTLKLIKALGFKTFDRWWDESYDDILDHNKRFEAIYQLILSILEKDKAELEIMLHEMTDVLIHNFNNIKHMRSHMFDIGYLD